MKISVVLVVIAIGLGYWLFADLPAVDGLAAVADIRPSVRIVDREGRPLYDLIDGENGRNIILPLHTIPLALQQATIATEDKSFYDNPGLDALGIIRALWLNVRGGEIVSGGSTITQQVVRNVLLSDDERGQITLKRKLREAVLAWQVSHRYDKETVLALYLNQMYYGGMAYGVEAAAQTYFGKSATQLTLAESALIAGLPQSPALYNPLLYPEAAKGRQTAVLDLLLKEDYITANEYELAVREPLFYAATPYPVFAPHFVMMVQSELDGLLTTEALHEAGGVVVRTTLDLDWQEHAESIVAEQLERLNKPISGGRGHHANNAALVAMDPQTGEVRALVGNVDYFDEENEGAINMALRPRQPGSTLKPIVYAAGMDGDRERPFTPASLFYDVRTVFMTHENDPYVPVNFSRDENGPVLLRQALASSLNIPAVQALDTVGVDKAMGLATEMGIGSLGEPDEYDLSFALGGGPVTLFDLTRAYAAFANGGSRIEPLTILEITDVAGNVLYKATQPDPKQVLDARVAWLVSDMLSDNRARLLSFGENSILQLDRTAAVKTGTTNDFHDNWTVGYTPDVVVGVWVGNANNEPMFGVTGVSGAGPIWHYFMRTVLNGTPDKPFPRPEGLVQAEVCDLSGLRPTAVCPFRRLEWFIRGTEPAAYDDVYQQVQLDRNTGLLATEATPAEQVTTKVAVALPPVLHPWARAQDLLLLDDLLLASERGGETAVSPLQLISPDPNTVYRISPAMPLETQKLAIEVVTSANIAEMTVFVDGTAVGTLTAPHFQTWWTLEVGQHQMWVEAVAGNGNLVKSEVVVFEVLAVVER